MPLPGPFLFFCANFDGFFRLKVHRQSPLCPEVPSRSPPLLARNRRRDACNAPCPDAAGQLRSARRAAERCAICGRGQGQLLDPGARSSDARRSAPGRRGGERVPGTRSWGCARVLIIAVHKVHSPGVSRSKRVQRPSPLAPWWTRRHAPTSAQSRSPPLACGWWCT